MADKVIQIFKGGAVVFQKDGMNRFDINGQEPVDEVPATEGNIKKYIKEHRYPKRDEKSK